MSIHDVDIFLRGEGLDSEASGPPDRGASPRECRGVPCYDKIGGAPAFSAKIGQQTEEFAMQRANQDLSRLRQAIVLPCSASERCYLGKHG